uniref:Farnesyl pyrophosphate synthase n=1 Tax=Phlebotomus papatasi TaxID=29031 RepID=A0A1B0DJD3_PHLPP
MKQLNLLNLWVLNYNIPGGKNIRGVSVMNAYKLLVPKESDTEQNLKLAGYLGWCNEMLHASVLMFDDVMDRSITRRGRLCWYKLEDIQLSAINDSFMIKAGIYQILKEHFTHLKCYTQLLELFNDMCFIAFLAEREQRPSQKTNRILIKRISMEFYQKINMKVPFVGCFSTQQ